MFSFIPIWCAPPEGLRLASDEVHVWRGELDRSSSYVQSLLRTLTADERSRAERLYFQNDRERFIVARGILRAILSRYLDTEPSRLRFCYTDYGKPAVVKEFGGDEVCFNVSHSHGLALFAVTRGRELGVDLEWRRSGLVNDQIAEQFFSAQEIRVLHSLPRNIQDQAFFNCWTRKEAYIKAKGEGFSMPLDRFSVSLAPGEPAVLMSTEADPQEAARWSLRELFPAPGFVAAVAVKGDGWQLKCWQWQGRDSAR